MYQLFLDDERQPKNIKWIDIPLGPYLIARNYNQFVEMVEQLGVPSFISFDHDLADEHYKAVHHPELAKDFKEKTGADCAKWMIEYCLENKIKIPDYTVHSMNINGKENIISIMESGKKIEEMENKNV